jgi:hypothetical protein
VNPVPARGPPVVDQVVLERSRSHWQELARECTLRDASSPGWLPERVALVRLGSRPRGALLQGPPGVARRGSATTRATMLGMSAWAALAAFWWHLPPAVPYNPPLPSWDGRVVTTDNVHLGVRPHSDAPEDAAITVQVSVRTPW